MYLICKIVKYINHKSINDFKHQSNLSEIGPQGWDGTMVFLDTILVG